MYYNTEWEAKDWLGNTIRCSHEAEGTLHSTNKANTDKIKPTDRRTYTRISYGNSKRSLYNPMG